MWKYNKGDPLPIEDVGNRFYTCYSCAQKLRKEVRRELRARLNETDDAGEIYAINQQIRDIERIVPGTRMTIEAYAKLRRREGDQIVDAPAYVLFCKVCWGRVIVPVLPAQSAKSSVVALQEPDEQDREPFTLEQEEPQQQSSEPLPLVQEEPMAQSEELNTVETEELLEQELEWLELEQEEQAQSILLEQWEPVDEWGEEDATDTADEVYNYGW